MNQQIPPPQQQTEGPQMIQPVPEPVGQPANRRSFKRLIIASVAVFTASTLLVLLSVFFWYQMQLQPKTATDIKHVVTIKSGSSTAQIASLLAEKDLIRSETAFSWYARLHRNTGLQAGTYRLSSASSTQEIFATLETGKTSTINILIPPGLRQDQIEKILRDAGYEQSDLDQAFKAVRSHPLLAGVPSSQGLEGYLFPDTYQVAPDTTATQLVTLMLDTFQKKISPEIESGLVKQGLNMNDAVILASIVQKEVSDYETQQTVAQVFLKRMREGVMLGSDVTYMYAAALTGQQALPSLDSPYNTRKYTGLPPGPIANFNINALKAVATPTETTYNFFVAGDDGTTHFTYTVAEHEAAVARYCTKLCQ